MELDRIANGSRFLGSVAASSWRADLYTLRNRIVHEGLREVTFGEAKAAIVAALRAIDAVQGLTPAFHRNMNWSGTAVELQHVQQSAGRISRLFES